MSIKGALAQITQKVSGWFLFNNHIEQKVNCFENKEIVDEYLKSKLFEIDTFFINNEIDEVQRILNEIQFKKEKLDSQIEMILLKFQALVYLNKGDNNNLMQILQRLENFQGSKEYLQEIKFNIAIKEKKYDIFNELKIEWINEEKDKKKIEINEIKFLFLSANYKKVIEMVNEDDYRENKEILNLLAVSLSCEGNYEAAEDILNNIKKDSEEYKLSWICNKFNMYFSKIHYVNDVEDVEILKAYVTAVKEIDKKALNRLQIKQLDMLLLRMMYFINIDEAEIEFNKLNAYYNNDYEMNVIGIDIFDKVNKLDVAEELAEATYNLRQDINTMYKILTVKSRKEKWKDIIDIYNGSKYKINDDDGLCRYLYGLALIEKYGETCAYKILKDELKDDSTSDLLLLAKINIDNKEKCEDILDNICSKVSNDDLILINISNLYLELNLFEKAINCIEKGATTKNVLFKKMINISVGNKYNLNEILDIYYDNYMIKNDVYIDSNIYYIAAELQKYRYAYLVAKKLYVTEKSEIWTNEYIRMKLINEDFENLYDLVKKIENISQSECIITAAEVYAYYEDYQRVDELCYKAFYYLDKSNNKSDILNRINVLSLNKCNEYKDEEERYRIKVNDVITLKDRQGIVINICLNGEIYYQKNKCVLSISHINMQDRRWIELIGREIGNKVFIDGIEYEVIDTVNKITYMYRISFQNRIENAGREGIKQVRIIQDSKEQIDFSEMKEFIQESNKKLQNVIDIYINKENGIGIPIYSIKSDKDGIKELLESLMYTKDVGIVAGESIKVIRDSKVVLTLLTTITLEINNILDDFLNFYEVFIGDKTITELNNIVKMLVSKYEKKEMSLHLIDDKFFIDEKNEEYKTKRINFYRGIIDKLQKASKVEKSIIDSKLFNMPDTIIKSTDIQSIEVANELKAILFVDDLFYSKLAQTTYPNIYTSNMGGFVATMVCENYNKYISIAEKLIKERYQYVFNIETLGNVLINYKIDNRKNKNNFKKMIDKLLLNDINHYYESCLRYICLMLSFKLTLYSIMKIKIDIIMNCINDKK